MNDFFNQNKSALVKNFDHDVLKPLGNRVGINDPGIVDTMFSEFVRDEEKHNSGAYQNMTSDQSVTERLKFNPNRKEIPADRPSLEWDYKPIMPDDYEENNLNIVRDTEQNRRDQSYIANRIRNPKAAAFYDKLVETVPGVNHNDLGPTITDDQTRLNGYYEALWPEPDSLDYIGPANMFRK